MTLRTRLLIFVLLFSSVVLTNILALMYLARSVSSSLNSIEDIRQRQLVAVQLNAHLRDAEAALYRYQIDGEVGFKSQFLDQLNNFSNDLEKYRQLATDSNERQWADTLAQTYQQTLDTGNSLLALRDRRASHLEDFLSAISQLTALLFKDVKPNRPGDSAYQAIVTDMQDVSRAMLSAVTGYIASPDETKRLQFTDAVVASVRASSDFHGTAQSENEERWAGEIADLFNQTQHLGSQLIGERDLQQSLYANFISIIFTAGQQTIVEQIEPYEAEKFAREQQGLRNAVNTAIGTSIGTASILSVIALLFLINLSRQVNTRTAALLQGAERVSAGDLTERVSTGGKDELSRIANAFNDMMTDLATRERRLKARLTELEALRRVSLQLTSALDPQVVLETIAENVLHLSVANEVRIYTGADLSLSASANRDQTTSLSAVQPNNIVSIVASTGQMHVANWSESRSLFDNSLSQGAVSIAGFPLRLGEQVLGVLFVTSSGRRAFTSADIRFLNLLADQAAVALGNASLFKDLHEREERLRALIGKMAHIQDEERRLIGLDLHDGLTQIVISANMHINALEAFIAEELSPEAAQELEMSRCLIKQAIDEARRVITELRPTLIEDFGLEEGLRRYVTEFCEVEGWNCEVVTQTGGLQVPSAVEAAIFRIAQEALTNTRKYARTEKVRVELVLENGSLMLRVQDWGQGFEVSRTEQEEAEHLGLIGMRERAQMINGVCKIESQLGKGTWVEVLLPLESLTQRSDDDDR
ncbi:MAG: GAF domain-containing protein [Anaerolineales bacterium]|jgi:signal transduction histidine kinase